MIKNIYLENFMSHLATRIDLAPGVTVITGPNNVGKSAVVEAIRSLVLNPSQKYSIRHGAKQAVVRLELASGEIIEWVRTDKTAYYRVLRPRADGEGEDSEPDVYRKIGLAVPEDIRTLLRLGRVETESGDIDIHIGNQRDPIFLLNSPGSHAAGFFAASTEAEYLLRMRQTLKTRGDYAKTSRKVLVSEGRTLEKDLGRYQPLDALEPELAQAEKTYEVLCRQQESLPALAGIIGNLAGREAALGQEQQGAAILQRLAVPPEMQETTSLESLLRHWRETGGKAETAAAGFQALAPLSSPPSLEETPSLAHLAGRLKDTANLLDQCRQERGILVNLLEPADPRPVRGLQNQAAGMHRLELALHANRSLAVVCRELREPPVIHDLPPLKRLLHDLATREEFGHRAHRQQETLAGLASPPDPAGTGDLLQLLAHLARVQAKKSELENLGGTLAGLAPAPAIAPPGDLEELIRQTGRITSQLAWTRQERDSLAEALEHKRREVEDLIRETGLCPLCGSPMDVSHFLEAVHG